MRTRKAKRLGSGRGEPAGETPAPSRPASERLAYVADLIGQLQGMAEAEQLPTLSGLLALAHAEALREAGRRR